MEDVLFRQTISEIVTGIEEAGYDPYEQLVGYLKTGQEYYITRRRNARSLIHTLDKDQLQQYVNGMGRKQS